MPVLAFAVPMRMRQSLAEFEEAFVDEIDEDRLAEQFGDAIVERVDFEAGRVEPSISIDLSLGVRLFGEGARSTALQLDVFNVFDRLNVINFAGLLSGTAIAPARSFAVRLQTSF